MPASTLIDYRAAQRHARRARARVQSSELSSAESRLTSPRIRGAKQACASTRGVFVAADDSAFVRACLGLSLDVSTDIVELIAFNDTATLRVFVIGSAGGAPLILVAICTQFVSMSLFRV